MLPGRCPAFLGPALALKSLQRFNTEGEKALFMLYVSQYTKCSVMVPLTFCAQTNDVKEKRSMYETLLTIIDLIVYFTLIGIFVFECFENNNE